MPLFSIVYILLCRVHHVELDFVPFLAEQTVRKGANKLFGHQRAERLFQRRG